jgi:hypothetical protein
VRVARPRRGGYVDDHGTNQAADLRRGEADAAAMVAHGVHEVFEHLQELRVARVGGGGRRL